MKNTNSTCDICGKSIYVRPTALIQNKNHHCSVECSSITRSLNALLNNTNEDNWGIAFSKLWNDYYISKLSFREIGDKYNSTKSNIQNLFKSLGLQPRNRSESIKNQWVGATNRRLEQSKRAKATLIEDTKVRDKALQLSKSEESIDKIRKSKLGSNNPMYGITGQRHHNWNPNITDYERERLRKDKRYVTWSHNVKLRDKFTCMKCGDKSGGNLESHHISSFNSDVDNRYNISNGVTLCTKCHKDFHLKYGYGNNTKNQFKQWSKKYLK